MLRFKDFILDEDGVGVVEMVLIVVVLIALVLIFKNHTSTFIKSRQFSVFIVWYYRI